jgi:GGDEF domain-containing protein
MLAGRQMPPGTLSVSIGVASRALTPAGHRPETGIDEGEALFHAADQALYVAKQNGKDQTAVAQ